MATGLVGEGGGELGSGVLVGVVETARLLTKEGPEVLSEVLNGVVEVWGLLLPSGVPGAGGEAVPAGRRGGSDGRGCPTLVIRSVVALLQCQASHGADVSGPAPKNIFCHFGSIALIIMQARAGSEGQAASIPVVGDSGLLGGGGLLGGEGGVTVVVVTGVAAVEAVTGVAAAAKVTGVAAAVGVAGTAAEVVAAVMGPLCCTAAFVLAVPVVSEKVAGTSAGQAAFKI